MEKNDEEGEHLEKEKKKVVNEFLLEGKMVKDGFSLIR